MQKRQAKAIGLVVLSMVFYGISFPATRMALGSYGPITIVTSRLLISSVLLMSMQMILLGVSALPKKRDLTWFIAIGVFQPFLYFLLETFGLQRVSPSVASIIIATIPVFTPVFSRWLLKERLTIFNILGLLASCAGVVILVTQGAHQDSIDTGVQMSAAGFLMLFGAVIAAVIYTILVKKMPKEYSPLTITALQNTVGLLLFLPLMLIFEVRETLEVGFVPAAVTSIIFLAVFASSLAFIFLNYGIQELGAARANGFVNLVPVVTAVVSFVFLGEHFGGMKILGMSIVFFGVLLAQVTRIRSRETKKRVEEDVQIPPFPPGI